MTRGFVTSIPSINVDQTPPTNSVHQSPAHRPSSGNHSQSHESPAAAAVSSPGGHRLQSAPSVQSKNGANGNGNGNGERKLSHGHGHGHGLGKSNSMRVPRMTERRHTLPPRQESVDAVSSTGSNTSTLARSIKVVCVTAGSKDDLAIKLLKDACDKKKVQFQLIDYNAIAFDEVKSTEQFLFADIAFVHLVSKEEESKLFLKIGHRRNYGKNVNVVLYQIPGNVSDEEQNSLLYLKELCVDADAGLLPYYSQPGTSNSSNDMSLDLNHVVLLPALKPKPPGSGASGDATSSTAAIEWTSLAQELRRVLNGFKQVANKDEALPIVTEMRDLMKSHKGVSLQVQLRRVYEEKLKQSRSQLTFETVHLFMMALRECQDYASMIDVFRYVKERNYDLSQKEGLIYLYAFALNRRQRLGDREEALEVIETVEEPSADMLCLCGRIYKDLYIESQYQNEKYLNNAIDWYKKGAQLEPSDYAMINLATLLVAAGKTFETDKDLKRLNNKLSFSIGSQGRLDQIGNYWVVATYFELCVLLDDKQQAVDAARRMFHLNAPAWYIKSTLHNLKLILSKRQELAKSVNSPYSNSDHSLPKQQKKLLTLPGHSYEDSAQLFEFWMQFFLFVGEDTSKSFCEYPVLVIEQVTHATSASAHRTYEFVPANLIIHRGPCSYGANVPGPIESFDLLLIDPKHTNWQFTASDLAAVNTYMNDGRCLLMYVNKLDDFQVYFPSEIHRDRLYETLKSELFPDKNPIAPSSRQQQITNFEILTRPNGEKAYLGSGAYGKVFKAVDKDTDAVFALKVIEMGFRGSSENGSGSMQVLRDEIQLHMRLKHQNIVKFLGHHVDPEVGKFYIFMEFVNGGSLSNFLTSHYRGGLPDATAAQFTNQILDGLIYLHEHEVIHRDIKGANVLVDLNNKECPIMKIADFGTSKQLSKISNLLNTNMKGTPNFLAPEVIACPRGYTYTADVWSLGCTVIEMISGKIPFHGIDPLFIIFQVGRGTVTPPVPEKASKEAAEFIEKCCKTNPEDRISPKELKMESWIAKHCRSQPPSARGGGGGSDRSSESSAVGSRDHIPKSDSRQGLNKEVFDRSKSVPYADPMKVNVEDDLVTDLVSKTSAKFRSDPAVEDIKTVSISDRDKKLARISLKECTGIPSPVGVGGSGEQKTKKSRHKSGDSQTGQSCEVSTPTKSGKRKSIVDGIRHALTYFIETKTERILDLWILDTQRTHCQNRLQITTELLNMLLMTFRDYLRVDMKTDEVLDGGLETVLEWIGTDENSLLQIGEIFSSLQCFISTIVKLLKECGDSPNQILQTASVLEPMVEHAHFLLARKRPEAVEGTTTGETTEDSSDEEEGLNQRKGTREDLDDITETSDAGFDPEDFDTLSLNAHRTSIPRTNNFEVNDSSHTFQQRSQTAPGGNTLNRQRNVQNPYSLPTRAADPRNINSEPNSIGSSGITGSLSGFSAQFLSMAQETTRLERYLSETQQTLNNLLSIQVHLNQARISDVIRDIQSMSGSRQGNSTQTQPQRNQNQNSSDQGDGLFTRTNLNNLINQATGSYWHDGYNFPQPQTASATGGGWNSLNAAYNDQTSFRNHLTLEDLEVGQRLIRSNACELNSPAATSTISSETTLNSDQPSTN